MNKLDIKAIPGFPDYAITNNGKVWSKPRKDTIGRFYNGRWLSLKEGSHGYFSVMLYKKNKKQRVCIHRLVLETFVGPCPPGMEACHYNGNRLDNRLENLRWDTRSNNQLDAVKHGTSPGLQNKGEKNNWAKLTDEKVRVIRYLRKVGFTLSDLAWQFDVHKMTISTICAGKTWRHII